MPFVNRAVYQKSKAPQIWCRLHHRRKWAVLAYLPHLITQQINNLINVRKRPTNFIILHECTKNHTHMAYSYQEMMCISVQAI